MLANIVLKVSHSILSSMKIHYADDLTEKLPAGAVFCAKRNGCTITAYKSGKVLFQGNSAEQELKKWEQVSLPSEKKPSAGKGSVLPAGFSSLSIIGSDEVGTGDYFGPITVVAAFVRKDWITDLKHLGVQDSKQLSDQRITDIAKQLVHTIPYSLLVLHNEKYNELQKKGMSQGKMKALLHNRALLNVLHKISPEKPDAILVDQFAEESLYFRYLETEKDICKENVYFQTKGESVHIAVAAASILARFAFLREMEKLSKKAGFTLPKGAGSIVDEAAARLIAEKGEESLFYFAKRHFANTEKALRLIK
jgi:ribonuclease HIII